MRLARLFATLGLVLLLAVAAACGGDDEGDTAGTDDAGAADADAGADGDDGSADVGEGADEADGATAADGDGSADGATDSPDGAEADDSEADGDAADGPTVDPSIEVPEWVEVVGVEEALNVRAGPSSSFDRVAQIPPGETLRVLGGSQSDEGGLWLQVVIGGDTEGWVFAQYTSEIARPTPTPLPTPTPVGTPTPLPVDEDGDGGADDDGDGDGGGQELRVVAPDGLNLRDAPGLDSNVIAELDDGDRLEGTGRTQNADGRDWTEVRVGGQTGWVASEFVR
ncbi:MAG: SH3 domain-containing protein [Acidimicrobiales bacterium]